MTKTPTFWLPENNDSSETLKSEMPFIRRSKISESASPNKSSATSLSESRLPHSLRHAFAINTQIRSKPGEIALSRPCRFWLLTWAIENTEPFISQLVIIP